MDNLGDDFWKILRIQLDAWFAAYTRTSPLYGGFEEVHTYSTLSGCARVGVDTASWADLRFLFVVGARVFIAVCDGRRLHQPFLPGIWQSLVRCSASLVECRKIGASGRCLQVFSLVHQWIRSRVSLRRVWLDVKIDCLFIRRNAALFGLRPSGRRVPGRSPRWLTVVCCLSRAQGGGDAGGLTPRCSVT